MDFEVVVKLKKEVLSPEGRAIHENLERFGYDTLKDVEVSKRFVLSFEGEEASELQSKAEAIADKFLANPVSETFKVTRIQ